MLKKILQITVITALLSAFALPASALVYHFNKADTIGTWNLTTTRNISSFGIFAYTDKESKLPLMLNPLKFTIKATSLELLGFVYPNLDDNYFAGHLKRFRDCNEEGNNMAVAPVPEPATLILLGSGLGGLLMYRKRRAQ